MGRYVLKRILLFVPTLFVITLLAFVISVIAPGDPCDRLVGSEESSRALLSSRTSARQDCAERLGLNLPAFYITLNSWAAPDTFSRVVNRYEREALSRMLRESGDWASIDAFRRQVLQLEALLRTAQKKGQVASADAEVVNQLLVNLHGIKTKYRHEELRVALDRNSKHLGSLAANISIRQQIEVLNDKFASIEKNATPWKNYLPVVHWHSANQYHRWLFGSSYNKGILRGDFGISYRTKRPVNETLAANIFWSASLTLLALVLAYLVSLPMGILAATKPGGAFDRYSGLGLFVLYSLPSFWLAIVLLMTFSNPDVLVWFPSSGVKPVGGYADGTGVLGRIMSSLPYLVLPVFCYFYGALAFLSRTMRVSMLEVLRFDFIRTARAKGLPESKVILRHGLRNAWLPIITVFSNVFPAAIGGSVIIESIFSIPGMGQEIYEAILNNDYPVIVAVFTLTGILTILGYLVADVLYALADPRISFTKTQSTDS